MWDVHACPLVPFSITVCAFHSACLCVFFCLFPERDVSSGSRWRTPLRLGGCRFDVGCVKLAAGPPCAESSDLKVAPGEAEPGGNFKTKAPNFFNYFFNSSNHWLDAMTKGIKGLLVHILQWSKFFFPPDFCTVRMCRVSLLSERNLLECASGF